MDFGKLHVVLVHFPIAFALGAVAAEIIGLLVRRPFFKDAALYCLLAAAVTVIPAVIAGDARLDEKQYAGEYKELAENHEQMGYATLGVLIAAAAARLALLRWRKTWLTVLYVLLIAAVAVCVTVTGDLGGQLVQGKNFLSGVF